MQVPSTQSRICLISVWCLPLWICCCEAYWILLWCFLKLVLGCVGSGHFERGSGIAQYKMLPVAGPQQPFWNYKQFTVLAASAGPGSVWKGPNCAPWPRGRLEKVPRHSKIFLHLPLPAGCPIGWVTEWASGCTPVACSRFPVSHQVGMSSAHQVCTGLKLVPVLGLRSLIKFFWVY